MAALKMTCRVPSDDELIRQNLGTTTLTGQTGDLEALLKVVQRRREQLEQWGYWVLHVTSKSMLRTLLASGAELVTSKDMISDE